MDNKTISGGSVYKVKIEKLDNWDIVIVQDDNEIVVKAEDIYELVETLKEFAEIG